ncbi:MAG: M1 family aminopeptidase [Pyrinomonadaceae bacterium]
MKLNKLSILIFFFVIFAVSGFAQQAERADYDIKSYSIDVSLQPDLNKLSATVDVELAPLESTRAVTFELNGSLAIKSVEMTAKSVPGGVTPLGTTSPNKVTTIKGTLPKVTFVQDKVGVSDLGPSVRVDLGEEESAGTNLTLRFKYDGILSSPAGGPLLTKRLAYVGPNEGYLMYAARWFPFHDYASDKATAEINVSLPNRFQVVGQSDLPVSHTSNKWTLVNAKPGLIGNLTYGVYANQTLRYGAYEIQFSTKAGNEKIVSEYGEVIGRALEFYTKQYGAPAMGSRLKITQIDDESLEYYSQEGMLFMANRLFNGSSDYINERLQRETAYQWWGLTVGLKSFDDAWISQGLAEYSAFRLRESRVNGEQVDNLRRELLEKALTFEQTSSLLRTPSSLDDQSIAYQYIMFAKGAMVFDMLRETMGADKFDSMLRAFLEQYRGKNASISDLETLASKTDGKNLRYFFARWVEGTGVPEFQVDYVILRNREGKFITRGTVKENYDNLELPVELQLRAEGQGHVGKQEVFIEDSSADFNIESDGKPIEVIVDPSYRILRISDDLRVSSVARRGIEQFKEGNYVEAQTQFEEALKLDRSNAWVYYHLGLLFLTQRNYDLAIDNFKAARNLAQDGKASPTWLYVWSEIKMGNAYDAKGDRTRAVAAYKRAEDIGDSYDNAQKAVEKYMANPYNPNDKSTTAQS